MPISSNINMLITDSCSSRKTRTAVKTILLQIDLVDPSDEPSMEDKGSSCDLDTILHLGSPLLATLRKAFKEVRQEFNARRVTNIKVGWKKGPEVTAI